MTTVAAHVVLMLLPRSMTRTAAPIAFLIVLLDDERKPDAIYAVFSDNISDAKRMVAEALAVDVSLIVYAGASSDEMAALYELKPGEVRRV